MEREEILNFLEAIDAELASHAKEGDTLDLYMIGGLPWSSATG